MPDVILPALDEAAAIPAVIAGLPPGFRAIVVDNGSIDRTAEVARAAGAQAVAEPRRRFGWPLEMVLRAARAGWRIEEVRVRYSPRVGRSKVTGTIGGTTRAARAMARLLR